MAVFVTEGKALRIKTMELWNIFTDVDGVAK
jgi:hypothetical protein